MTGLEAWHIIAPILGAQLKNDNNFDKLDEAYVVTFCALTDYDKKKEEKHD